MYRVELSILYIGFMDYHLMRSPRGVLIFLSILYIGFDVG
jgi:hypothetical protein